MRLKKKRDSDVEENEGLADGREDNANEPAAVRVTLNGAWLLLFGENLLHVVFH